MGTCPGCGAEVEFSTEELRVATGTCASCQKVTTFIEGTLPAGPVLSGKASASDQDGSEESETAGLECSDCGTPLRVEPGRDGSIQVSCSECETVARFIPETSGGSVSTPEDHEDRPRGPRSAPRDGGPAARPCRQCGAPLRFSTDANGFVTGECASCGNRFTLPPRDRERSGGDRYRRRPPSGFDRRPRGWSQGGSGYRRPPDRRRRPDRDAEPEDERRRRRRRE